MESQPFTGLFKKVWASGQTYEAQITPATIEIGGVMITSFFDFIYPFLMMGGKVYCVLHTATDVSDKVVAFNLVRFSSI